MRPYILKTDAAVGSGMDCQMNGIYECEFWIFERVIVVEMSKLNVSYDFNRGMVIVDNNTNIKYEVL